LEAPSDPRVETRALTANEVIAERVVLRLDGPVTVLGVVALLLWLTEPVTADSLISGLVEVAWLMVWFVFIVEFIARAVYAPSTWGFLRGHWWEAVFLAVPFLRFVRALRVTRAGRGLSSVVRSTRSAAGRLQDRLIWLGLVTAIIAAASGRLLWEHGGETYRRSYLDALHDGTLSTLKGDSLVSGGIARWLEIVLATYSVVIVATLASTVGAFFMEHRRTGSSVSE
jgi:voltage-gated potassium channel